MRIVENGQLRLREAQPSELVRQQVFYHGTASDAQGRSILKAGIQPGNQTSGSRGHLTPVSGRTYLTPTLRYGVIYCIGGELLGCSPDSVKWFVSRPGRDGKSSRYGWLFVIQGGHLLNDVQPDEDSVGEFLASHTETGWNTTTKPWRRLEPRYKPDGVDDDAKRRVWSNIKGAMTDRQFHGSIDGMIAAQAAGGKRALKRLSDADKLALIGWGGHVAYQGALIPDQAWRFDKLRSGELEKDGSNFFALAERVR